MRKRTKSSKLSADRLFVRSFLLRCHCFTNWNASAFAVDPAPYIDGARINSPHYLCKIIVNKDNPVLRYTLVISQYEKSNTILYSLRAFSTSPFTLKKIINPYKHKEVDKSGTWSRETAGGCRNHQATFHTNPAYQLTFSGSSREEDNEVMIELRGPKDYAIGLEVSTVTVLNQSSPNYFKRVDSGAYRSGFTLLRIKSIPVGTYQIIPATYLPGQVGPFFITVNSTHPVKLSRLRWATKLWFPFRHGTGCKVYCKPSNKHLTIVPNIH